MSDDDRDPTLATTTGGGPREHVRGDSTFDRQPERFRIGDELGRGGMGRVVAATDAALDRDVAIKQALSQRPEDLARFAREVRITARLEHPSIVPVHEAGRDAEGRPYYVMRKIAGQPLAGRIAGDARARLALVPNVLAAVDAAAFAHARRVIHRDIKPANILLGDYGETLLIDWGLARKLDEDDVEPTGPATDAPEQLTRAGHVYGTIAYMAPEQARGEPVDARADVYALGATLFHVLAGVAPFDGISAADRIINATLGDEPLAFDKLTDEVPGELAAIVAKAMAHEPAQRYADAGELAADLRAFLAGKLVAAHVYTTRERIARWLRKYRFAVAVVAAALVTIIVVGVIAIANIVHARDVADDKSESLLLDRASGLAASDPARAVALLRHLPADSRNRRRARDIAAVAAAAGIAHGSTVHHRQITTLVLSPDGKWLLSGDTTGLVVLRELAAGTNQIIAKFASPIGAGVWLPDGKTIVLVLNKQLVAIDLATHEPRVLASAPVHQVWAVGGDRLRYYDLHEHSLHEIAARTGAQPITIATGVTAAEVDGDVAIFDSDALHLLDGTRDLTLGPVSGLISATIDRAHGRVAITTGDSVVEYDLATGNELSRYATERTFRLMYTSFGSLYGVTHDGRVLRYSDREREVYRSNEGTISWLARTRGGLVVSYDSGRFVVIDRVGLHTFNFPLAGSRLLAANDSSPYIATGSVGGLVRWWDLTNVVPAPLPTQVGSICWVNSDAVFVLNTPTVSMVDRKTGAIRTVGGSEEMLFAMGQCGGVVHDAVSLVSLVGSVIIDIKTGAFRRIDGVTRLVADWSTSTFLYVQGRELHEVTATGPDRVVYTASEPIGGWAAAHGWAITYSNDRLVRIHRATGETDALAVEKLGSFVIGADGAIWYTVDSVLHRWDGTTDHELHELPEDIQAGADLGDSWLGLELADNSVWVANTDGRLFNRAGPAMRTIGFGAHDMAAWAEPRRFVRQWLISGERADVGLDGGANTFVVGEGGRTIALSIDSRSAVVYEDVVPEDPASLPVWLDAATNAELDLQTGELTWR